MRERIRNASKEPTYGLHRKKQMPFFRVFAREIFGKGDVDDLAGATLVADERISGYGLSGEDRISRLVDLTQQVFLVVERELRLTGFWESAPARNKLRGDLQKILVSQEFLTLPGVLEGRERILSRIMELAMKNNDIILYSE